MFPTFKIFVIYLIIPSRCANVPSVSSEKTTSSVEELVKKELSSIENSLKSIFDPLTKNDEKLVQKGMILGEVEKIIERAVKAEIENKMLWKNQVRLETEKDKGAMYQLLLALTYRVDTVEKLLAPGENFDGQQRSKRWKKIFTINSPAVENLRNKVLAAGMTEVSFAEQVETLIQERNNLIGYANIPLPRLVKEKTIEGALEIMEITEYDKAFETVKILVAPVKGLDFKPTQKS